MAATPAEISAACPALQVQLLSDKGRAPTRGSAFAAGYDIYRCVLNPNPRAPSIERSPY